MKWSQIHCDSNLIVYRHGYRAVALGNEIIIIFGGGSYDKGISNQLNVFKISSNKTEFFLPFISGNFSPGVAAFGMILFQNLIVVFGGMKETGIFCSDLFVSSKNKKLIDSWM
jgi:hypothetical protein